MKPATEAETANYTKEELYQLAREEKLDGSKLNRADLILLCGIISDELGKINKIFDEAFGLAEADGIDMTDRSVGGFPIGEMIVMTAKTDGRTYLNQK